ncbi:MAG: phosphoadenosine phosphosulfate reductase family protein [Candidatus Methanomethylicaceae archaeon]
MRTPQVMRVNPIYDWNDQEVWKYIEENKLPYNPLYDMGYRRVGCWCCPLNGPSHYKRLKRTHPRLYEFLERFEPKHPHV